MLLISSLLRPKPRKGVRKPASEAAPMGMTAPLPGEYQGSMKKGGNMRRITIYASAGLLAVMLSIGVVVAPGEAQESDSISISGGLASTAAKPAIVVDSTGAEIGPLVNTGGVDTALVKTGGHDFALQVNSKGFVATGVIFSYTTGECTGTTYVLSPPSNSLYISYASTLNAITNVQGNYNGGVAGTILYYAKPKTSISLTINSISVVVSSGKSRVCYPLTATKSAVTDVATFDLSTLGFVAPFKLSF